MTTVAGQVSRIFVLVPHIVLAFFFAKQVCGIVFFSGRALSSRARATRARLWLSAARSQCSRLRGCLLLARATDLDLDRDRLLVLCQRARVVALRVQHRAHVLEQGPAATSVHVPGSRQPSRRASWSQKSRCDNTAPHPQQHSQHYQCALTNHAHVQEATGDAYSGQQSAFRAWYSCTSRGGCGARIVAATQSEKQLPRAPSNVSTTNSVH